MSNRKGNTLKLIIDFFVKAGKWYASWMAFSYLILELGTHVMVDCWAGYHGIDSDSNRDLIVQKVNHSKNFRDPVTGACTNTVVPAQL